MTHSERQPLPLDWKDSLIALGIASFSLALYVRTLAPGLLPGDGGEFQTLAYTLGHAHTTGYEVYLLLANLFTRLVPAGDIAYRVNLFSAVCGGLTVGLVYLAGRVLTRSRWAGLLGALALAISAVFWSQAIIAEVYTAGSVFTAGILLLVLLWSETRRAGFLFAAGAAGGLAVGVHNFNSLFAPAVVVLLALNWRDLGRIWKPALAGVAAGLALMLAAFLVVDAQATPTSTIHSVYQPSISRWDGQPQELDSFSGRFAFLVFARQWRSAMFTGEAKVVENNFDTLKHLSAMDFPIPLRLLAAAGLIALFARRWRLGIFFCVALLVSLVYVLNYRIGDIYVFFIALYVYICLLVAEGAALLLRWLARLPGGLPGLAQPALGLLLIGLAVAPVYPQRMAGLRAGEIRFPFMNLMSNRELQGWHAVIVDNVKDLPRGAVVLTDWERLYPSYYATIVEQGRTDLLFLETYPYSTQQGLASSMIPFLKGELAQGRPVLTEFEVGDLNRGGLAVHPAAMGTRTMFKVEPN